MSIIERTTVPPVSAGPAPSHGWKGALAAAVAIVTASRATAGSDVAVQIASLAFLAMVALVAIVAVVAVARTR
ncbi:hypothetical protein [Sorangium sp. So ce233]|uniref:hypothetical protein n=1 Tax=Sorangium sp. So ce233 TaxID=3133290 RepID=UPI003F627325